MYWIIDGDEDEKYESVEDVCNFIFDPDNYDDDDAAEEWINECYYDQKCEIGGETYYPADIVKNCDDYTYRELVREWACSQSENDSDYYYSEIENMEPEDVQWINGYKVECFEEEDEEPDPVDIEEAFNSIIELTYTVKTISDNPSTV